MDIRRIVVTGALLLGTSSFASAQTVTTAPPLEADVQNVQAAEPQRSRPAALLPLYAMQFTLNGLDVHSTLRALDAGHREGNPLFRDGDATKMIGAKMASSALSVFLAEKLWKKNRVAAVLMMAGVNAGLTVVVANNYRLAANPGRR